MTDSVIKLDTLSVEYRECFPRYVCEDCRLSDNAPDPDLFNLGVDKRLEKVFAGQSNEISGKTIVLSPNKPVEDLKISYELIDQNGKRINMNYHMTSNLMVIEKLAAGSDLLFATREGQVVDKINLVVTR